MSKMTILFDEQLRIVPFIIMPEEFHHRVSAQTKVAVRTEFLA